MTTDQLQEYLKASNFDAIEDAWLAHLEEDPTDTATFTEAARALVKAGERDRARFLVEMIDDQLDEGGKLKERLAFLRALGDLRFDQTPKLHRAILQTLKKLHGESPSYDDMLEKVGLTRAPDDVPKTWKKVDRFIHLLLFDIGSKVLIKGHGAGTVVEVNMALDSFKVDLVDGGDLRVGFGGAAKLLKPLPTNHILRLKMDSAEQLEQLRDGAPAQLLRVVLESYDHPMAGAEVRKVLVGIVSEKGWNKWWTAARKHPQVLAAPGGKRAYTWAESSADAEGTLWESFEAADPRGRLDLLRQNGDRDDLRGKMAAALDQDAVRLTGENPGQACEIWFGLDKFGEVAGNEDFSPHRLFASRSTGEVKQIIGEIRDRAHRERASVIARDVHEDWKELFPQLMLQEADAKVLDRLAASLLEDAPEKFWSVFDQLLSQAHKFPAAFVWLAERAGEKPAWMERNPPRLLRQLLRSLSDDTFAPWRAARLEKLLESGGTAPRILGHLTDEQAPQALDVLDKVPGLQDYQRDPLRNALYLKFPNLHREEEAGLYALPESIDAKREELRVLLEEEIPTNRKAIEEAREMGDLRENFEYKAARQRAEYLAARAANLNNELERVRPIDPKVVEGSEVVIGAKVRCESGSNVREITILGPWESDPENDVLASESELAASLLGTALGESVTIGGESFEVTKIEPFR